MGSLPTRRFGTFVCLYIAEGYKRDRNRASLANSDPFVIRIADRWIRCLADKTPVYSLQYHADQDLLRLREFWGGTLKIEPGVIRMQRKSNSNQLAKRTWRSRHGVLQICVDDTRFRARLQAWMDRLRSEWR
jgi:hypothetical protein